MRFIFIEVNTKIENACVSSDVIDFLLSAYYYFFFIVLSHQCNIFLLLLWKRWLMGARSRMLTMTSKTNRELLTKIEPIDRSLSIFIHQINAQWGPMLLFPHTNAHAQTRLHSFHTLCADGSDGK